MTKASQINFRGWQVAALVVTTIVTILISSSPRTAFYSMVVGFFLLANGVIALVSGRRT